MTEPFTDTAETRPEPVLEAAAVVKTLGLIVGAVVLALGVAGVVVDAETVARITAAISALVGAGYAVWALIVPIRRALALRAQVTPVESPRDVDGARLIRADGQPFR